MLLNRASRTNLSVGYAEASVVWHAETDVEVCCIAWRAHRAMQENGDLRCLLFACDRCKLEVSFFRVVATRAAPQFTSNYPHLPRISYGLPATHKYPLPANTHKYKYLPFAPIT